ncbi:phage antirepressor protein [archaeon]|nr:phage antirepressor protein [archaeon]
MDLKKAVAVFQGKEIRRAWHKNEWWFSIFDIVEALTGSSDPKQYIKKMRQRDPPLDSKWGTICTPLELMAPDGKKRETNCVNTEGAFRIIQSIPSLKAEPFKLWLAKVGYDRVKEIENPELAQDRVKQYYELKGYPKDWIDKRLRGMAIRQELTEEWKNRGVDEGKEFAILTNEITKATFGKTVQEYKEFKGLPKNNQNLRDHMKDWELILTMVGEKATTDITTAHDSQGFDRCKESAQEGGEIAHDTRTALEKKIGRSVVSSDNFLNISENKKLEQKKDRRRIN